MRTTLRIGSIGGIDINIHISWLIIVVLLTASLALGEFPALVLHQQVWVYWVASVITVLLFFASVLAHELAHSFVARSRGIPVKSITLFIFGGAASIEREPQSAGVEFLMAVVGPLTSMILGGIAVLAAFGSDALAWPTISTAVLFFVGVANLALGVFNLIPGFPMDGGRVLRSIIWKATGSLVKATRWAANVGQVVAYLLIFYGVWLFFLNRTSQDMFNGVWIGLIGLFILQAARAESTRVQMETETAGITVQQFMTVQPPRATPDLLVQQFVDEYLLRNGERSVLVVERDSNRLIGVVTLQDVRKVARERWGNTFIGQIMTPLAQLKTVQPEQSVSEAITLIMQAGVSHLPVVARDGQLVGMLSLTSILEHLQLARDLGVSPAQVAERQPQERPLSKIG